MTISEAIKKAIEGGYKEKEIDLPPSILEQPKKYQTVYLTREMIKWLPNLFLDPFFWQSLGKAMGWKESINFCCTLGCGDYGYKNAEWLYHWHRFIDHLAERKSAEEFFKELK